MFRTVFVAMLCVATPALSQVVIPENGIQIAAPDTGFRLYDDDEFIGARLWIHKRFPLLSITILDKQDPENSYTGMDWDERAWDPIVSQDAHISSYYQGDGWHLPWVKLRETAFISVA